MRAGPLARPQPLPTEAAAAVALVWERVGAETASASEAALVWELVGAETAAAAVALV
jgi:hypothetical protein